MLTSCPERDPGGSTGGPAPAPGATKWRRVTPVHPRPQLVAQQRPGRLRAGEHLARHQPRAVDVLAEELHQRGHRRGEASEAPDRGVVSRRFWRVVGCGRSRLEVVV